MMYSGLDDVTKQRMMQAKALSMEARGGWWRNLVRPVCIHTCDIHMTIDAFNHVVSFLTLCIALTIC